VARHCGQFSVPVPGLTACRPWQAFQAQALLKAVAGWTDQKISEALNVGVRTVQRIRQRFVEQGIEVALDARQAVRFAGLRWNPAK